MEEYCLFCINYRNKLYMYYIFITGRLLKEHYRLVNDKILFKCKKDEIYSVAAALNSMGYNRGI
jgi:hypothetical protein